MVFSSIVFLLYFLPLVFLVYYAFFFSRRLQNIWLLAASLIFYAWGEPIYVLIMLASIFMNWIFGLLLLRFPKEERVRKLILLSSCVFNLGLLGVFKYLGFIVETVNGIMERAFLPYPGISLPIGISFFTFQALSYVIDVYEEKTEAQRNLLDIALYISFFPQLIAGPIVRYSTIAEQIRNRRSDWDGIVGGICRFAEGLCKKVLIANNLAVVADTVFNLTKGGDSTIPVPVLLAWLGAICYMFQLYYDFSAYSDMAIGLGRMFGFQFQENFRYPFVSRSVREFMTRWHISLATWFSQYVYKPLGGGSTEKMDKMIRNLFIVWLLTGLWHGAAWTYVWWGLYFFLLIVLEIVFRLDRVEGHEALRHVYVIVASIFAMVIFRCESGEQMSLFFSDLFGLGGNRFYSPYVPMLLKEYGLPLLGAILLAFPIRDYILEKTEDLPGHEILFRGGAALYVLSLSAFLFFSLLVLAKGGYNPFIYFNF